MSRVAVFFPKTVQAAWSLTLGIGETLRRMSHDVLDCPTPRGPSSEEVPAALVSRLKFDLPSFEQLSRFDAILVSGPEHIAPWLDAVYGALEWRGLPMPRGAFYHESSSRADGGRYDFDMLNWVASDHFFPAVQDAEFHDQEQFFLGHSHWSPFAVDTTIFCPCLECPSEKAHGHFFESVKDIDIGFIGGIYPYRASFLEALGRFQHPPINIGQCVHQTIDGVDIRRSMEMMAIDIRRMRVFFNLPALSQLLVTKVFEVMACGTFCLTPLLATGRGNMKLFENEKHLSYYRAGNVAQTSETLKAWLRPEREAERETIAQAGMHEVHEKHSLERRLAWALHTMGVEAPACN